MASGPDILLITVDTLRADHLGIYGYARDTSPNINRWFEPSVVFERAYATETATAPSVASLLTGRLPQAHRVRLFYQLLPEEIPTIADVLGQAGYDTAGVVSNMVLTGEAIGLDDRFDHYDDYVDEPEPHRKVWERNARRTTDAAIEWLRGSLESERPHLLWVHYIDPHGPYAPPPDRPRNFEQQEFLHVDHRRMLSYQVDPSVRNALEYVDRYDEEIAYCDREIGRLLETYSALGMAKNAVMVFSADHGETMAEHERWFTHQYQVYEAIARVPLMIRAPGQEARRVERPVSLIDLAPTLLELAGVALPETMRDIDGRSLFLDDSEREVFIEATSFDGRTQHRALIQGDTKYVMDVASGSRDVRDRLRYDLSRDRGELERLPWRADDEKAVQTLIERIASDPDPGGKPNRQEEPGEVIDSPKVRPGVSDSDLEKLRALGYVH